MRSYRLPFAASIALASAGSYFVACGGDDAPAAPIVDASVDVADTSTQVDTGGPLPIPDGSVVHCTLDNGSDPIALCVQKLVLQAEHEAAFTDGGVAASWDSNTGIVGAGPHDFHDDVAFGAALGHYIATSQEYGDSEIQTIVNGDLTALAGIVEKELTTTPADYDGELYANLRAFQGGLNYLDDVEDAAKIGAIADAYARGIYANYYHLVSETPIDAGAPDASAGSDAGDDAAITDAGAASDADASSPSPFPDGMLGELKNGHVDYDAQKAASGALALLDMVARQALTDTGIDAGDAAVVDSGAPRIDAVAWQRAARSILDHLWNRARHPQLGLFYSKLETSGDPAGDALQTGVDHPDMIETDTQGLLAVTFLRARALAVTYPAITAIDATLFETRGEQILITLNGTPSFWDKTPLPTNDAGSGFFEGYVPSTTTMVKTKPIRGNALLLAALHRASLVSPPINGSELGAMRSLFTSLYPHKTSFLTQALNQNSYLPRTSADLDYPSDDAGSTASGTAYTSASNHVACEALTELWVGISGH